MTVYNTSNRASATFGIGGGTTSYDTIGDLPLVDNSTGDTAFVTANNKLYIWNGSGWYTIATVNETPTWDSGGSPESTYTVPNDGSSLTITLAASDPEGFAITYTAVTDSEFDAFAEITQNSDESFTVTKLSSATENATGTVTFRASDGVNILSGISTFSIAFSVQNSKYTSALITSVGSNAGTNSVITDSSSIDHTITVNGDASTQTFSPYRQGGYSYYFDGNGDTLTLGSSSGFAFGTGDFTIDFWIYATDENDVFICDWRGGSSGGGGLHLTTGGYNGSLAGAVRLAGDAGDLVTTKVIDDSQWHHVAIVRSSGTTTIYIDGESNVSQSDTINYTKETLNFCKNSYSSSGYLNAYLSDFRIVKGTAVYTADFTPPTERLEAITNTSLLTCHLPYLVDGSSNNHTITPNGNVSAKPFAPYDYNEYDSAIDGGSVYFDGSSDYATVPSDTTNLTLDGDFTIDFWVYPTSAFSNEYVYGKWNNNSDGWAIFVTTDYSSGNFGSLTLYYGTYGLNEAATSLRTEKLKQYQWNHCRITKESGVIYMAINGVVGTRSNYGANGLSWEDTRNFNANDTLGIGGHTNYKYGPGYIADLRVIKGTALTTTNFTIPTEPSTAVTNTKLLISGTDASIIDKSSQSQELTLVGNTQSSTTQTKHASSSMYFDGSGDYITLVPKENFAFGTGDFTVEAWVYLSGNTTDPHIIDSRNSSQTTNWVFGWAAGTSNGTLAFYTGTTAMTMGSSWSSGQWYHLAVSREGTTLRGFVDGTQVNSITDSRDYNVAPNLSYIGDRYSATNNMSGYLEDVRITKGLARYTANFTPPTASLKG